MVVLKHEDNKEIQIDEMCESEKKRLESLKHKKEIFKTKELAVRNALKNLDGKSNNNKIIFDDEDFENVEEPKQKVKQSEKKRKRNLFDDDNDSDGKNNDESIWDDSKFDIKKNATGKLLGCNITLGNDKRFKLDERFMEDDHKVDENITTENSDETDLRKEKELQLDILENILGAPIVSKNQVANKDSKLTKKGMIRYDPTENDHKEYEVSIDKSEADTKKTKKKKKSKDSAEDATDNKPVEVSKDVYFSVSDTLSKSLKEGGQFSLLKTYAKAESDEKGDDSNVVLNAESQQPQKFQFNFTSKNPFKYDSSDDEHDDKEENTNTEQPANYVAEDTNKFFFDVNDVRFNEAQQFFSKESAPEGTFKELRQELKQIMRSKIRRNVKKKQPWGYKKKVKRSS